VNVLTTICELVESRTRSLTNGHECLSFENRPEIKLANICDDWKNHNSMEDMEDGEPRPPPMHGYIPQVGFLLNSF